MKYALKMDNKDCMKSFNYAVSDEVREHNTAVEKKRQEKKNKKYLKHIQIAAPKVFPIPESPVPTQGNLS